jgi:hypothetical protein
MKTLCVVAVLGMAMAALFACGLLGCGEEEPALASCADRDGDGFGDPASPLCPHPQQDCDDSDPLVHPGSRERCTNGIDDNCDGLVDLRDAACELRPFSFVVLADPHIEGDPDHEARLLSALEWINLNRAERRIELVLIVGDIAWGEGHLERTREMLDTLAVPYLPLIGDNEIQSGFEREFNDTFSPQYEALAGILDDWHKAPAPVWNPEQGTESFFQNFSFDHRGVHFVGLDWCTRRVAPIVGEQADLHDFPGGTFEWFRQDIEGCPKPLEENIVMASHHPMHFLPIGAFTIQEQTVLERFTSQYRDALYADFAGHYHLSVHNGLRSAGYEIYLTQSPWVAQNALRIVTVDYEQDRIAYSSEIVTIP